ncbi:TetR/AcrR family transcriptional regulator [Actinoplanes sp. LDG1-06]|uniref:TetR/AcrR family transcriptional regulator n=1 Tax=Paractinoplanes ovalisporus TaxID=2810368 RepID=A0ABS2ASA7_9ACTN|nr:TetR/AcrR family transcriptional regulator [Actinoplanes ovalisporus]MBM2622719.1 TetR/AcrR family transcriptional regulator [Actinoplanes ovalisporus]
MSSRPERADRRRNRDLIVNVAREAFARADAAGETLSMNEVARTAGVGVATLYRHFPTREDLAAAVYESKLADLTASVVERTRGATGAVALQTWVSDYAAFMLATRGMMDTLRSAWQSGTSTTAAATHRIAATVKVFLDAGAADHSLRAGVDPMDATVGILALLSTTPPDDTGDRARRLLTLFVNGLSR